MAEKYLMNEQLERAALSTILSDVYVDDSKVLLATLEPEDFGYEKHRIIFILMKKYEAAGYPLTLETIVMDGAININDLSDIVGMPGQEAQFLIKKIRYNRMHRETIHQADNIKRELEGETHSELTLEHLEESIDKFKAIQDLAPTSTWRGYKDVAHDGFSLLSKRNSEQTSCFIETGFNKLDKHIGGLRPGNLIIIAARPGMGKTALLLDFLKNISEKKIKSAFLSMEMQEEDIFNRQVCKLTDVPIAALYDPKQLWASHWETIVKAAETIHSWPIIFSDRPLGLSQTLAKIRDAQRLGCQIVAIDQLSKIKGDLKKSQFENSTDAVQALGQLSKELKITIILLSQINRKANESHTQEPELWHLKNTGSLEEEADIVLLIHRPWEFTQDPADEGKAFIKIAKNRNGRTGTIEMYWVKDRCGFCE